MTISFHLSLSSRQLFSENDSQTDKTRGDGEINERRMIKLRPSQIIVDIIYWEAVENGFLIVYGRLEIDDIIAILSGDACSK